MNALFETVPPSLTQWLMCLGAGLSKEQSFLFIVVFSKLATTANKARRDRACWEF
jgi:hypothetical protein